MNPDISVKTEVLKGMKEIEAITGMLGTLKQDLKKKKYLLQQMEGALGKSEDRLHKKVIEIDDKERKIGELEKKYLNRQEELKIQEKELQTNWIIEFLTFQAREMEVKDKLENIKESDEVDELNEKIKDREREIEIIRQKKSSDEIPDAEPIISVEDIPNHLKAQQKKLEEIRENLNQKEIDLLKKEEELKELKSSISKEESSGKSGIQVNIAEREKLYKKMDDDLKRKQNDINELAQGLRDKEKRLSDLENDLKMKQEIIDLKEQRNLNTAGTNMDSGKARYELEREFEKRIRMIEENHKEKTNTLINEIDMLKTRNEDLEMMGDQLSSEKMRLTLLEKELRERVNEISFSEERMARRQELMLKERKQIDEEIKKMKSMKDGSRVAELNEDLANRQKQLRDIELKLREKEEYIRSKEREIRKVESSMIDKEISIEMEIHDHEQMDRVRTGVRRFDDLCFGGFPYNSNFILLGPAYSGRTTFTNLFIGEGLKKGIPAIYIVTQSTPKELKDKLRIIIPRIDVYEEKGLIKFIDLYSKSMGIGDEYPNTLYVDKPTDLDAISNAIETVQNEFKKKYKYHKIVFFSLSTMLTYIESLSIFRFFQVLNAKNKRNGAVSLYVIDTGMHDPSVIQTLKHVMTGFIET